MLAPSPNHIVWAVAPSAVRVTLDPDRPLRDGKRTAPYHMTHLTYEPLTTPTVLKRSTGLWTSHAETLLPRLAESWLPSDDYRRWTFRLRDNVRSAAGNRLTAADVKWAWDRTFALRGVGLWRSRRMAGVASSDDVRVVDDLTLQFQLVGPNPQFAQYFVFATNNVVDATVAQHHGGTDDPWATEWLAGHAAGHGPFAIGEWTDDRITFQARDDYWAGRPGLNAVSLVAVASREEAFARIERGDVSLLTGLQPRELRRFEGRPDFTVWTVMANHATIELNWSEPPFNDHTVRRAVAKAIPYERILAEVYDGRAWPSRSPIGPFCASHTKSGWQDETDPPRARRYLAESSQPDGFATELVIRNTAEARQTAEIVREALADVGIEVTIRLEGETDDRPSMWLKEDCGHALSEAMYDFGHDYDPPRGMWPDRFIRNEAWVEQLKAIRQSPSAEQPNRYRAMQREILAFTPCIHLAELQAGVVLRGTVDPWAFGPDSIALTSTVWTGDRSLLPEG